MLGRQLTLFSFALFSILLLGCQQAVATLRTTATRTQPLPTQPLTPVLPTPTLTPTPTPTPTLQPSPRATSTASATPTTPSTATWTPAPPTATPTATLDPVFFGRSLLYVTNQRLIQWRISSGVRTTLADRVVGKQSYRNGIVFFEQETAFERKLIALDITTGSQIVLASSWGLPRTDGNPYAFDRRHAVSPTGEYLAYLTPLNGDDQNVINIVQLGRFDGSITIRRQAQVLRQTSPQRPYRQLVWSQQNVLSWADETGIWQLDLDGDGVPVQLFGQSERRDPGAPDANGERGQYVSIFEPALWSPDGRYLLIGETVYKSTNLHILDTQSLALQAIETYTPQITDGILWTAPQRLMILEGRRAIVWEKVGDNSQNQFEQTATYTWGRIAGALDESLAAAWQASKLFFCDDGLLRVVDRHTLAGSSQPSEQCATGRWHPSIWSADAQLALYAPDPNPDKIWLIEAHNGARLVTDIPRHSHWVRWHAAETTIDLPTITATPSATATPTPTSTVAPLLAGRSLLHLEAQTLRRWDFNTRRSITLTEGVDLSQLHVRGSIASFVRRTEREDALVAFDIETQTEVILATIDRTTVAEETAFTDFNDHFFVSPNGAQIAYIRREGTFFTTSVLLFEVAVVNGQLSIDKRQQFNRRAPDDGQYHKLAWSADGKLSWSDTEGVWLLDLNDVWVPQKLIAQSEREFLINSNNPPVRSVYNPEQWSPDGRYLMLSESVYEGALFYLYDLQTGTLQRFPDYIPQISQGNVWHGPERIFLLQAGGTVLVWGKNSAEFQFRYLEQFNLGRPIGNFNLSGDPIMQRAHLSFCKDDNTLNLLHKETLTVTSVQSRICNIPRYDRAIWSPDGQIGAWQHSAEMSWRLFNRTSTFGELPFSSDWVQWYDAP